MAKGYEYTTDPGDSLTSIAEAWGHSGEWQVLAELNAENVPDPHNIQPGMALLVPADWVTETVPVSAETTATTTEESQQEPAAGDPEESAQAAEEFETRHSRRGSRDS